MFDRKEAPFRTKKAEMSTTAVEQIAPLVMKSPEISKQSYDAMNVTLKLQKKRETNYRSGRFIVNLGTFTTVTEISKKPYTTMNVA